MPDYIKLCIKTIYHHCEKSFNIQLLNSDNISVYIPELKQLSVDLSTLPIQQKVDIYRLLLLYKYGGLYMDTDIIVLQDLKDIAGKLSQYDFVGFGCTGDTCKYGYGMPSNWLMASRPNTELIKNCIKNATKKMSSNKNVFNKNDDYHGLGKKIIWEELSKMNNYKYFHYHSDYDGTRDINGNWVNMDRMFSNEIIKYSDPKKMMFIVLYNSDANDNYKNMKMGDILKSNMNISNYIKKSLGISI